MTERQLLVNAFRRLKLGERAVLATIVSVEGSSNRRPGARMLISENSETTGVLNAGCFERDVCERAATVMSNNRPSLVRYDTTADEDIVWGLGLGCNGVVYVLIEPVTERVVSLMQLLGKCVDNETSGAIATVVQVDGKVEASLGTAALLFPDGSIDGETVTPSIFDDLTEAVTTNTSVTKHYDMPDGSLDVFIEVLQPRVRLVIFGAGFDVLPVVELARNVGWHTSVVETRARVSSLEQFQKADTVWLCRPEDVSTQLMVSERSVVIVMTHNYLHDLELLRQLLPLPLRYLGCLGPGRRTERLLQELAVDHAGLEQLHAPVGLDIGAETPEEIALSIVSEIKAVLAGRPGGQLRARRTPTHDWCDAMVPAFFNHEVFAGL